MSYIKENFENGDLLEASHLNKIEDAISVLDDALNAKQVEVEKTYYALNRFDKNKIEFDNFFYVSNRITNTFIFSKQGTYGGGGWLNIPIEPGKTYTMSVSPVILTDMDNIVYGNFINLWFVDGDGKVITQVPYSGSNYYYAVGLTGTDKTGLSDIAYAESKVSCSAYGTSNTRHGMGTNAVTFTVKDSSIAYMHVQIGANQWAGYEINEDFNTRGHLTEEEIAQIQNSFQINEGTELLEYSEGGDYTYTVMETQSNLTKLQDAFSEKIIPSTNLLNPAYALNHKYIANSGLSSSGAPILSTYNRSCLLEIPIELGSYILHSENVTINNKSFGYFGEAIFCDKDKKYITGKYSYKSSSGVTVGYDTSKVTYTGAKTTTVNFTILDENIKYIYIPLLDSDMNGYGLWTGYSIDTGLSDDELLDFITQMQLNSGKKLLKWESYDATSSQMVLSPNYIEGLDDFKTEIEEKVNDSITNASSKDSNMSCSIQDNKVYVRAKCFMSDKDMVWSLSKVNESGGNKYFNIDSICTCPSTTNDEDLSSSLTSWKGCSDDICPPNINGTYIAANHGFNCVDKITSTDHGKTESDIGSVWKDSNNKTYVLTHIYDENTLGFIMFNDTNMQNGCMSYGNPTVGTNLTHSSEATDTSDVAVEARAATQMWQCFNNYSIRLLVDGEEIDITKNNIFSGDRVEIITQYNVIYIPAMLTYLRNNVGSNTVDSQHSDNISDFYMTMYINYQFNKNGSVSTYSSFYMNKDTTIGYIGLVQSQLISSTPYTYLPDTSYKTLTLHDGSITQSFTKDIWDSTEKVPYRYYQFSDNTADKGIALVYDRSIGWGENTKRLAHCSQAGMFYTSKKMYPAFIAGGSLTAGQYFDGMAARVPLYKYDEDLTSVGWYWCNNDIILMIDTHNAVDKDIILPNYMNNMHIEVLDKTDTCTFGQTYIFSNKLRFQSTDYGYVVLRLSQSPPPH